MRCTAIGYRVRQLTVDMIQKTVTLNFGAMVSADGQLIAEPVPAQGTTRRLAELDPIVLGALKRSTDLVTDQMQSYDRRRRGVH